jgi:hypothetical protein
MIIPCATIGGAGKRWAMNADSLAHAAISRP